MKVPRVAEMYAQGGLVDPADFLIAAQADVIDDLRDRLRQAAQQFRAYERLHAAKPDLEKARRNAEMAELCEAGLVGS